jgi:hypothetical protein
MASAVLFRWMKPSRLLLLAAFLRLAFMLLSGKLENEEFWEYGEIGKQLLAGHGYSFPFTNEKLEFLPEQFYPSALMPPGYVFFLLPFLLIQDLILRNFVLFMVQTGLSLTALWLVYLFSRQRFGEGAARIILLLQAIYPELIYACCTVGPTIWFHLLMAGILFHLPEKRQAVFVGILSGMLVLMRSEAILPIGLMLLLAFLDGERKASLITGITLLLCLSPWLIRNQLVFGKPMLSANSGVNFYRGNNPGEIADWPVLPDQEMAILKENPSRFEQGFDAASMNRAIDWLQENPEKFIVRLGEKALRFWLLDWPDPRTHSPIYWLPWLLCLPLGILGLWQSGFRLKEPLSILFLSYTLIALIFFPQARYLTLIKFFWMIPAGAFLIFIMKKRQI